MASIRSFGRRILLRGAAGIRLPVAGVLPSGGGGGGGVTPPATSSVWTADDLFDAAYYLAHNQDVANAGLDARNHFFNYGWTEDRDPSAIFSLSRYKAANPDCVGDNPVLHCVANNRAPVPRLDCGTATKFRLATSARLVDASAPATVVAKPVNGYWPSNPSISAACTGAAGAGTGTITPTGSAITPASCTIALASDGSGSITGTASGMTAVGPAYFIAYGGSRTVPVGSGLLIDTGKRAALGFGGAAGNPPVSWQQINGGDVVGVPQITSGGMMSLPRAPNARGWFNGSPNIAAPGARVNFVFDPSNADRAGTYLAYVGYGDQPTPPGADNPAPGPDFLGVYLIVEANGDGTYWCQLRVQTPYAHGNGFLAQASTPITAADKAIGIDSTADGLTFALVRNDKATSDGGSLELADPDAPVPGKGIGLGAPRDSTRAALAAITVGMGAIQQISSAAPTLPAQAITPTPKVLTVGHDSSDMFPNIVSAMNSLQTQNFINWKYDGSTKPDELRLKLRPDHDYLDDFDATHTAVIGPPTVSGGWNIAINRKAVIESMFPGTLARLVVNPNYDYLQGIFMLYDWDVDLSWLYFTGNHSPDGIGGNTTAGLRLINYEVFASFTAARNTINIDHCGFDDCDDGILGGSSEQIMNISNSQFTRCGYEAHQHNLYGGPKEMNLTNVVSHGTRSGNLIKVRSPKSTFTNVWALGGSPGAEAYGIDLGNGGHVTFDGVVIQKSAGANQPILTEIGTETNNSQPLRRGLSTSITVTSNGLTLVSDRTGNDAIGIWNAQRLPINGAENIRYWGINPNRMQRFDPTFTHDENGTALRPITGAVALGSRPTALLNPPSPIGVPYGAV